MKNDSKNINKNKDNDVKTTFQDQGLKRDNTNIEIENGLNSENNNSDKPRPNQALNLDKRNASGSKEEQTSSQAKPAKKPPIQIYDPAARIRNKQTSHLK